jgi:hypothetical protein
MIGTVSPFPRKREFRAMEKLVATALMLMLLTACSANSLSDAATSITPPRPLMDMVLVDSDGDALPADLLRNQWSFVILGDSECDETCLQYIETTRKAVHDKQNGFSIQRLLVLGYGADKTFVEKLKVENPDLVITILTRPIWAIFTINFLQAAEDVGGSPLFLVDPRAFLVAAYDDFVGSKDLANDLVVLNSKFSN